jgi:hypothetical protein
LEKKGLRVSGLKVSNKEEGAESSNTKHNIVMQNIYLLLVAMLHESLNHLVKEII